MPTSKRIDPVTVQVVGNLMRTLADEVEISMIRAAYSPVIKESFDCSAGILNARSEYWALADAIPLQLAVLASVQRSLLEVFPLSELRPGDVLFTNDPMTGAPHLNDFIAVAPVFVAGEPIAFVATLMHATDVGGMAPGSMPADATEIFQEGIRIPATMLVREGRYDERLIGILAANSRTPGNLLGDLRAQISATALGVRRVLQATERFGAAGLTGAIEAYVDYSEQLVRHGVRDLMTPGSYTASRAIEDPTVVDPDAVDHVPLATIVADVSVGDGSIHVDFSRSSDQVRRPINVVHSNAVASCMIALRCFLGDVPANGGLQRALEVTTRNGSVMNPVMPAAVGARALAAASAFDAVLDCLGQAAPGRATATSSGGTTMPYTWMARSEGGRTAQIMIDNSLTGGAGARSGSDGVDAVDNTVTNAMNLPVEILEQDHAVIVERHELRAGSGGAGEFRGGVGLRRVVRFREDGILSVRGHRHRFGPAGVLGGGAGAVTEFWLVHDGAAQRLPPQSSGIPIQAGDVFIAETPGGGGLGDPGDRDRAAIERDLARGVETAESALRKYGAHVERQDESR